VTRVRAAALASDAQAESVAQASLAAGGGALDAAISGFFGAAAVHPGVLLSPIAVLVGGVGEGGRLFDGRSLQPGRGTRRPRGFADANAIPDAARVPIPTSIATLSYAHAYAHGRSWRSLVEPAIGLAERNGAPQRARFLERIAEVGAGALADSNYRRPLLRLGSAAEGGLVTPSDLEPPELAAEPLAERKLDGADWLVAPGSGGNETQSASAVLSVDAQGVFAAVAYRRVELGRVVDELELLVPLSAVPVVRGVPRVAPGTRLGSGFALGLCIDERARPIELSFEPWRSSLGEITSGSARLSVRRDPETRLVSTRRLAG
jgi:hypothetical protein